MTSGEGKRVLLTIYCRTEDNKIPHLYKYIKEFAAKKCPSVCEVYNERNQLSQLQLIFY